MVSPDPRIPVPILPGALTAPTRSCKIQSSPGKTGCDATKFSASRAEPPLEAPRSSRNRQWPRRWDTRTRGERSPKRKSKVGKCRGSGGDGQDLPEVSGSVASTSPASARGRSARRPGQSPPTAGCGTRRGERRAGRAGASAVSPPSSRPPPAPPPGPHRPRRPLGVVVRRLTAPRGGLGPRLPAAPRAPGCARMTAPRRARPPPAARGRGRRGGAGGSGGCGAEPRPPGAKQWGGGRPRRRGTHLGGGGAAQGRPGEPAGAARRGSAGC